MKGRGGSKVVRKFSENSSILGKYVFPKLQENECTTCYISYICYIYYISSTAILHPHIFKRLSSAFTGRDEGCTC